MNAKGNSEEYRLFSDWKWANKLRIPFRLVHFRKQKIAYDIRLKKVLLNTQINPLRFEMP